MRPVTLNRFLSTFISTFVFIFIMAILFSLFQCMEYRLFNPDEFEHIHSAWSMKFQHLMIYKDYFEHHGPLLAFIHVLYWSILKFDLTFKEILIQFRVLHFLIAISTLLVIFFTVLPKKWRGGKSLVFLLLLIGNHLFFKHSFEIRPDFFLLFFLFLPLGLSLRKRQEPLILIAQGVLWGISSLFVAKSLFFSGAYILFQLIYQRSTGLSKVSTLFYRVVGLAIPWIILGGWFFQMDAFLPYLNYQLYYNVLISQFTPSPALGVWYELISQNLSILSLLIIYFVGQMIDKRGFFYEESHHEKSIIFASIFVLLVGLGPYFSQHFLMAWPVLSFLALKGIFYIFDIKAAWIKWGLGFLLIILFSYDVSNRVHLLDSYKSDRNNNQIEFINYVSETLDPSKKLQYFWGHEGGYVFFPHFQYDWYYDDFSPKFLKAVHGEDRVIENLMGAEVKPYLILEEWEKESLPSTFIAWINSQYLKHENWPLYIPKRD